MRQITIASSSQRIRAERENCCDDEAIVI